jgi:PiT family inorganic phosphate transporter
LLAVLLHRMLHKLSHHWEFNQSLCVCVDQADSLVPTDSFNTAMTVDLSAVQSSVLSIAPQTVCAERDAGVIFGFDVPRLFNRLHFCSAGAVCFARDLNDTPKIAALLLLTPAFNRQRIIVVIALAMALSGLFNARRVAETMSHKITPIAQTQGLSANLTTALLVIFASNLGMPVSTTHVSVGALFGIGLTGGKANTGVIASIAHPGC